MNRAENMTKYSLRAWVLVLALAPTILVGILLGSYFTINRFYELEQSLIERGSDIIEPLAIAAEIGLETKNFETTKRLLTSAQLNKSNLVQFIAIFDTNNRVIVTSHHYKSHEFMRYDKPITDLNTTELQEFGDSIILRSPIFSNQRELIVDPEFNNTSHPNVNRLGYIAVLINKENALLEQHRAAIAAFIIVLIGVQLNLLFTFRLVKNVTRPITEMVRVVAKIREGKLDSRVDGNLIGELDLLKRGINAMAVSLSDYHEEMQQNIDQATSDLRQTLEQIEIQNVELGLAKKRALEASRIKSEFLANMSHELRTPLNGVIGFAKQLLKTPLHSSQQEYIKTIEKSAINLLDIINDILDFSKLEAGKMVLENMPFSLREVIEDTITLLANSAQEKALELVIDIDPNIDDNVSGDALRFGQVLTNLVGNAIKFTDKGSVLLKIIAINETAEQLVIRGEVTDTGIGINEHHQRQLFQAFGQADSSISRRFGGTGLGLVITKRLINQMGGQIGCTSTPHKGSTFWFTLPLKFSKYPLNQALNLNKLAHKSILLFENKSLSKQVYEKCFKHWQMQVTNITHLNELAELKHQQRHFDFALISNTTNSTQSPNFISCLNNIKQLCDYSIYLATNNSTVQIDTIQTAIDKVLYLPVSERTLAMSMLNLDKHPRKAELINSKPLREPLSVLAVDDNPANLKLINTLLRELVSQVTIAESGSNAVEIARTRRFDLIFMDIQMPQTDGFSATKQIREDSLNRHTPIIAVTAHAVAEERERINQSGMNGYLPKPIDESALKGIINRWKTKPKFTHFDPHTLNWELCLTQSHNKPDLALEMLQMLNDEMPTTQKHISQALDQRDNQAMLAHIHKLHGASCYCGVPTTLRLCQEIEQALKKGEQVQDLEPEILELLDELSKVESATNQVLSQLSMDVIDE